MRRTLGTFGPAYDAKRDGAQLRKQHEAIRDFMLARDWETLADIHDVFGYPESSISAQLRHLRKFQFGGYQVEKRRREPGRQWEYRVSKPPQPPRQSVPKTPVDTTLQLFDFAPSRKARSIVPKTTLFEVAP